MSKDLNNLIKQEYNSSKLLSFKDLEVESGIKFEIIKVELTFNTPYFTINVAPSSNINRASANKRLSEANVIREFEVWIGWLKLYERSHLTLEDKILATYQTEIYDEYKLLDDDAETVPYSINDQLFIDAYLVQSAQKIQLLKEGKSESEQTELNELIDEAESIRKVVTKKSKGEIVRRLARFWGKSKSIGLDVFKEIFIGTISEIAKQLLLGK